MQAVSRQGFGGFRGLGGGGGVQGFRVWRFSSDQRLGSCPAAEERNSQLRGVLGRVWGVGWGGGVQVLGCLGVLGLGPLGFRVIEFRV